MVSSISSAFVSWKRQICVNSHNQGDIFWTYQPQKKILSYCNFTLPSLFWHYFLTSFLTHTHTHSFFIITTKEDRKKSVNFKIHVQTPCLFSFYKQPSKYNLCCPYSSGCKAIHWTVVHLPGLKTVLTRSYLSTIHSSSVRSIKVILTDIHTFLLHFSQW